MRRGRIAEISNCCFHVTHRCQERRFLLKFEIDRQNYERRLREAASKYPVDVLDYVVTSNHVHLLLWTCEAGAVAAMMKYLQGTTGRDLNVGNVEKGPFGVTGIIRR